MRDEAEDDKKRLRRHLICEPSGKKVVGDNLFSGGIFKLFRSPGIDSKE
jgi:hypothetical protein